MSEARRVVLEGGDYDGVTYDLRVDKDDIIASTFVMKVNGIEYRTCGETDKDTNREVMVYDG